MGCLSNTGFPSVLYHWYPVIHLGGERQCEVRFLMLSRKKQHSAIDRAQIPEPSTLKSDTVTISLQCVLHNSIYSVSIGFLGKRVDVIQKNWQHVFAEAAWHQPSVILFDDLDQVVSVPSALQELGGEALYKRRLAKGRYP